MLPEHERLPLIRGKYNTKYTAARALKRKGYNYTTAQLVQWGIVYYDYANRVWKINPTRLGLLRKTLK